MANRLLHPRLTPRDIDLLAAIELLSLTPEQLYTWSERFDQPFTDVQFVRRRLKQLRAGGLVRRWPLAIASRGTLPHYYKLTPSGFRALHGDDSLKQPRKRSFAPIGIARHQHTKSLTDFIVHVGVAAQRAGVRFLDLHPENAYCIDVGQESLWLDWRFSLVTLQARRTFNVELDCSTETIVSSRDTDSVGRKIRLLDQEQAGYDAFDPRRSITLFVTTRSRQRMLNILAAARGIVRNPDRALIYGIYLPDFLGAADPLTASCFSDYRQRNVALLPAHVMRKNTFALPQVTQQVAV